MGETRTVKVPDLGGFDDVDVLEVLVAPGDEVSVEDPLITLESDKASMDVPSPVAGKVKKILVEAGGKVSEGSDVAEIELAAEAPDEAPDEPSEADPAGDGQDRDSESPEAAESEGPGDERQAEEPAGEVGPTERAEPVAPPSREAPARATSGAEGAIDEEAFRKAYASPAVRKLARELGVDLGRVKGSGRKGRILKEDVQGFVKRSLAEGAGGGSAIPPVPEVDFTRFGEVETKPLARIRKLSAANLHRSWLNVPHVTQHDLADVTELEAFRQEQKAEAARREVKLTPVAFIMKATAAVLKAFPEVNSSLAPDGESLILKRYYHLGIAVDTPDGLVVPVVRDVDRKGLFELAEELGELSQRARDGKLRPGDLVGASFTISSLGGIGGTAFTPIVNAPEVAILGVSRSEMRPVWRDGEFVPRLMLPLSLSYDHRVIDGAQAVRFTTHLCGLLGDLRRLLL